MADETGLDPQARSILIAVVQSDGGALPDSPGQLAERLSAHGSFETEYALLIKALEFRIPQDLAAAQSGEVSPVADFLSGRFARDAEVPYSDAKWAVESWALALGKQILPAQNPQPTAQPGWQQQPAAQPGWQQQRPGVWPPPAYDPMSPVYPGVNTSGTLGPIPYQVEVGRWNWGAAGVGWIWLMAHNMVGWAFAALAIGCCVPLGHIGVAIYLGINGNRLAWQNRRFESVEHFHAVERAWAPWGVFLIALSVLAILYDIAAVVSRIAGIGAHTIGGP